MSANGGGEVTPLSAAKIVFFFLSKPLKIQSKMKHKTTFITKL